MSLRIWCSYIFFSSKCEVRFYYTLGFFTWRGSGASFRKQISQMNGLLPWTAIVLCLLLHYFKFSRNFFPSWVSHLQPSRSSGSQHHCATDQLLRGCPLTWLTVSCQDSWELQKRWRRESQFWEEGKGIPRTAHPQQRVTGSPFRVCLFYLARDSLYFAVWFPRKFYMVAN